MKVIRSPEMITLMKSGNLHDETDEYMRRLAAV